jgi:hypothetical protein
MNRGEGRVVHAVGGFQVPDHLEVVVPSEGTVWQEGHQDGCCGPCGEDDGLAPAVEDAVGQRDALVDDQPAGVGALGEVDDRQVG